MLIVKTAVTLVEQSTGVQLQSRAGGIGVQKVGPPSRNVVDAVTRPRALACGVKARTPNEEMEGSNEKRNGLSVMVVNVNAVD